MTQKARLSASIDADLLAAVESAVRAGDAINVSAWVNEAIRAKLENGKRLRALGDAIKEYEAEFGPITEKDRQNAMREAKRRAISVRGLRAGETRKKYGR